jgi:hypothetical protein
MFKQNRKRDYEMVEGDKDKKVVKKVNVIQAETSVNK